jgi:hypothetical protein
MIPISYFDTGFCAVREMIADNRMSRGRPTALLLGEDHDSAMMKALRGAPSDRRASVRGAAVQSLVLAADPKVEKDAAVLLVPLFGTGTGRCGWRQPRATCAWRGIRRGRPLVKAVRFEYTSYHEER